MKAIIRMLPAVFALALIIPTTAAAQSSLDTSAAGAFMGTWELEFESPQGAFVMELALTDSGGKVAANISSEMGDQAVTDISISGDALVLRYEIDAQGQVAPVALTVSPAGTAVMDFADGMFEMAGTATKQ